MVARVNIGQIILSIRCKDNNKAVVMEAFRRAQYKFPGRQKIIVSKVRFSFSLESPLLLTLVISSPFVEVGIHFAQPTVRFRSTFARLSTDEISFRREYVDQRDAGLMQQDGCYVQFLTPHGPLINNLKALERVANAVAA